MHVAKSKASRHCCTVVCMRASFLAYSHTTHTMSEQRVEATEHLSFKEKMRNNEREKAFTGSQDKTTPRPHHARAPVHRKVP